MRKLTQQQWVPSSGRWGRFVQNKGGRGTIPAWRMLLPHLSQAMLAVDRQLVWGQDTWVLTDSATHRETLDKCYPSLGSSCSSSLTRRLSVSHSFLSDSLWHHGLQPTMLLCHGISQARILGWVAIPISRESSQPRDQTQACCIAGGFFTTWASREAPIMRSLD